ncbi:unnamed protein product, partial [Heterotrigona itama]
NKCVKEFTEQIYSFCINLNTNRSFRRKNYQTTNQEELRTIYITSLIMKYALRKLPNNRRSQLNKNENTFVNECHTNDILIKNTFMLKKPMTTYRKKSKEILFHEKSPHDKIVTVHQFGNANAVSFTPVLSSTPKDKETLNDAKEKEHDDRKRTSFNNNTTSEFNKSQTNITLTVEENQREVKKKDATYELVEPKTPNLRKRLHEERNAKKENFDQRVTIKNSRVRFATRLSDKNYEYNSPPRTSYNEKKQINNLATLTPKNSSKKNILGSPIRMKSNSIKDTSLLLCNIIDQLKYIMKEYKYLASIIDSMPSTTKKVPNFAKIHKKLFAKSESIVDAKKRVKDRHTEMIAFKKKYNSEKERLNSQGENQLSKKLNENSYNRFGFKIRKHEAVEHVLRKKNNTLLHST